MSKISALFYLSWNCAIKSGFFLYNLSIKTTLFRDSYVKLINTILYYYCHRWGFSIRKSLIASTVHRELCDELGCEEIGIISEDSYYKDQSHLDMEDRIKTNYDHPNSMDRHLLIEHLKALKSGQPVDIPVYSYVEHTRTNQVQHFEPKK